MKKVIAVLLILVLVLGTGMVNFAEAPQAAYTVLVYMTGSDLESEDGSATDDLMEMSEIDSGSNVNVVVETGGSVEWQNELVSNTTNQRWLITNGGMTEVEPGLGKRNMGDPNTLSDFITWGIKTYPADKYMLVFWNHGGGPVSGLEFDELFETEDGCDRLTLPELQAALAKSKNETGKAFEVIGCDTCLMSNIETAYIFSKYASYMVASEEVEPGNGWDYTKIINEIVKNPSIKGDELGKIIINSYKQQCLDNDQADSITLAVTDLKKIKDVITKLESLIKKISSDITVTPNNIKKLAKGRSKSEDYGNSSDSWVDVVDLGDLADNLKSYYSKEATNLKNSIKQAVIYKTSGKLKPNSNGLSVYLPLKDKENFDTNLKEYLKIDFSKVYKDFVKSYINRIKNKKYDPVTITDSTPEDNANEDFIIKVDRKDIDSISNAYSIITTASEDDPDKLVYLGMDCDVKINPKTGSLNSSFNGDWLTMNGEFVCMFVDSVETNFISYTIPVELNGVNVDLLTYRDLKKGTFEVMGAWAGIDEEIGAPDKDIIKIKPGDKITTRYYYYNVEDDSDGYINGKSFTVGANGLYFKTKTLPAGDYYFGFQLIDIFGNDIVSDFAILTI